jgi:hypothetical protein
VKTICVNYYSTDSYAAHAQKLKASCAKYDVELDQRPVKPFRSWADGVCYKPKFISDCLNFYTASTYDGILWTDADSVFVRHAPWGELEGVDIGATRFQRSPMHPNEVLTGTMYFAINEKVKQFVDQWYRATLKFRDNFTPEQDSMIQCLQTWKGTVLFKDLGIEWCYIHDDFQPLFPKAIPVVKHFQASREFKRQEHIRNVKG